jgi:hypothetical protein
MTFLGVLCVSEKENTNMKVIGYGWIKTGETLKQALERYGVSQKELLKEGDHMIHCEKALKSTMLEAKKDFAKAVEDKTHRTSAKPRFIRVVLEELE